MFLLLATRNLFHSECSQCSRHTFTLYCTLHLTITIMYCSYIYNEVLSCIFKLNMKKYKHNYFFFYMEKCQLLRRKILSLSNISLFESETIFSRKVISDKKVIVMALCPATFRSFMVQWLAKIAGRRPQMKTLFKVILGKTMPKVPF